MTITNAGEARAAAVLATALVEQMLEIADLHRPAADVGVDLCRECLSARPCKTYLIATRLVDSSGPPGVAN